MSTFPQNIAATMAFQLMLLSIQGRTAVSLSAVRGLLQSKTGISKSQMTDESPAPTTLEGQEAPGREQHQRLYQKVCTIRD